jgi:iron complex transport system substrate-binding protein
MPEPRRLALWAALAAVAGAALWFAGRPKSEPAEPPVATAPQVVPRRVVTLSPALTEIAYALGAGDRLVGVSDFSDWPPEAKQKPSVGAFINPNFERITELKPDLVVVQGQHEKVREFCEAQGQAYVAFPYDSVADVYATLRGFGQRLGLAEAGEAAAARLAAELAAVRQAVAGRPPVATFVSVGRPEGRIAGLSTCGPGTFLSEILTLAGGRNVFADAKLLYPTPSLEALTARAPRVILDLQPGRTVDPATERRLRAEWRVLPTLPAVQQQRIAVITETYATIPGPRMGQLARRLAGVVQGVKVGTGGAAPPSDAQPPSSD